MATAAKGIAFDRALNTFLSVVDLAAGGLGHRRGEILNFRADGVDLVAEILAAPRTVSIRRFGVLSLAARS